MKKTAAALRIVIPFAIIVWLVLIIEPSQFEAIWSRDKDWTLLAAAFAGVMLSVCLTFVRWYLLVRTLNLTLRLRDTFRLGFLAYLLNFISFGSVGGDLFKAVFVAREQPGRRTEAIASVVVDRVVGLYALLLLTTAAILVVDVSGSDPAVATICTMTYVATATVTAGVLAMLIPGFAQGPIAEALAGLAYVGPTLERLITSVRMYRAKLGTMLAALAVGLSIHALLAVSMFLIAISLFETTPTVGEHFLVVPLSNVAGALPFTPAGLGTFEFAMGELYEFIPKGGAGDVVGVLVALAYRLITIVIAAIGVIYYWTSRRQVTALLREAERQAEPDAAAASCR